jgi:dihydrofolate synthase/folylpolyglutamate synthase
MNATFQLANVQLALAAIDVLRTSQRPFRQSITPIMIKKGLSNVTRNSGLHGRFEIVGHGLVLDVAHNVPGVRALVHALLSRNRKDFIVVFGVVADKDYPAMLEELRPVTNVLIAVAPPGKRALPAKKLFKLAREKGIRTKLGGSIGNGIRLAQKQALRGEKILITGSHYVVGGAMQILSRKA